MTSPHVYVVAALLREETLLHAQIRVAQTLLRDANISFKNPKLGFHITCIPPFILPDEMATWLALGLEFANTSHTMNTFRFHSVDVFKGEQGGGSTLILRLTTSDALFCDTVERVRSHIAQKALWKFKPESILAHFHITIAEDVAQEKTSKALALAKSIVFEPVVDIDTPILCKKQEGYWSSARV